MSALPRPDLPAGPPRDLMTALHDLHHRAGWPSLRTLARQTGVSHTTVSKVFSAPALPTWGAVEMLVEALDGDVRHFHELWLAASAPGQGTGPVEAPRIAGRRTELRVVRRHLDSGEGLLLVTGEAGIGKTTLVKAAVAGTHTFVAIGRCRPLSAPVPLLPVADAFRELLTAEGGAWFEAALATCPAYVGPALGPVLPELVPASHPDDSSDFARQRLVSAVIAVLGALGSIKPMAVLVEDLPWADTATLDLLAVLSGGRVGIPLVATWRTDDPDVGEDHLTWRARLASQVSEVRLEPLTRDETADQLALLAGHFCSPDAAERIYRRSRGQPLFTEQLATDVLGHGTLPRALELVLLHRLERLDDDAWRLMRALGIADRPLETTELAIVSGVDQMTAALRTLTHQRLVANEADTINVRHPLIAEAVRGRLVPGEAVDVHYRVAQLLAGLPDPPAGEIAAHWRAAENPDEELVWRIRAARAAEARFARREAFPEWARALELWGRCTVPPDERGADLAEVHTRTIESSIRAGNDVDSVRQLVDAALVAEVPDQGRAEILMRAADLECAVGDVELGLRLLDEAVAINDRYPETVNAGHVIEVRANIHASLGDNAQLRADVKRGLAIAAAVDAPALHRRMLNLSAWQHLVDGDPAGARERAALAREAIPASQDPDGAVRVASNEAEILLQLGASPAEVVTATADAAAQVDLWGFENLFAESLFASISEAHLRAGDVSAAWAAIEPRAAGHTDTDFTATQIAWSSVQTARGELDVAIDRLKGLSSIWNYTGGSVFRDQVLANALLWAHRPQEAVECLDRALGFVGTNDLARESSALLAMRARASADVAAATGQGSDERSVESLRLERQRAGLPVDPFGAAGIGADRAANGTLWHAELGRLSGSGSVDEWVAGAAAWNRLARPHDAAYCRWRAAQCALRDGNGTIAARLLKRAATDAREHVPLSRAIAAATGLG